MRLIPAIDLKEGRCVRLLRGDFDAETRYSVDPLTLLAQYCELGAHWLHIVDLDAARGSSHNRAIIAALAASKTANLQVGGGLRDKESITQMFQLGVARVVIGSAAITHLDLVRDWLGAFGSDRVTLAFDVRFDLNKLPVVTTHGWQQQSAVCLWAAVENFAASGLTHVLCTDVDRDGALSGPNVELYSEALRRYPAIQWQASGGIRASDDLAQLANIGLAAAISGKALLENRIPLAELAPFLPNE